VTFEPKEDFMMRTRTALAALATVTVAAAFSTVGTIGAQESTHSHVMVTPATTKWGAGPASLPPGAQAAALEGDPSKPGPFTLRIKIPDGYRLPPHWHPADEHVTVVQGTFVMGIGDKFEQTGGHELGAGAFALMPAGTRHYASAKGETVIQLHGTGPWGINYVNAADDPRKKPGMQ
jgi:quercetin dioxygenase-like cupin family protein